MPPNNLELLMMMLAEMRSYAETIAATDPENVSLQQVLESMPPNNLEVLVLLLAEMRSYAETIAATDPENVSLQQIVEYAQTAFSQVNTLMPRERQV